MKVEVRCPDCSSSWRVNRSTSGEMLCPACLTRIPLDGSTIVENPDPPAPTEDVTEVDRPPTAAAEAEGKEPACPAIEAAASVAAPATDSIRQGGAPTAEGPDLPPVAREVAVAVAEAPVEAGTEEETPEWMYEQVVCPRCNLHFQPRQRPVVQEVGSKKVLVVDDLAYFRQIAKDALEPTFEVTTAATSDEAREVMAGGGVDLLVLDLTLDGCNAGRDFLAELSPKPCPILIFTAQDESEMYGENWETLKKLGADDLVIKGMRAAESLTRKASALLGFPVDEEDPIG